MEKNRGTEVRREILLAVILILMFLTIVGTATVFSAIDGYNRGATVNVIYEGGKGEDLTGGFFGLTIEPPGNDAEGNS